MKITKAQTGLAHADRPLMDMREIRIGRKVLAITGSTKNHTWQIRPGVVTDITEEIVGETGRFVIRRAVVRLDSGEIVVTQRMKTTK